MVTRTDMNAEKFRQRQSASARRINERLTKAMQQQQASQLEADERYGEITIDDNLEAFNVPVSVADIQADTGLALTEALAYLNEAKAQQEAFAQEHGLDRQPQTPETLLTFLVVGVMVFGEAMLNTGFFINAHLVASPFSGLVVSFLISATNVSVSVLAGYLIGRRWSYGAHTQEPDLPAYRQQRLLARLGLGAYGAVMALFHLTVGLVRSMESLDQVSHSLPRYGELATTPEAIFLILLGLCMSALSFKKGQQGLDDPYLSYGRYGRAVTSLNAELAAIYQAGMAQIAERFSARKAAVQLCVKSQHKAIQAYNRAVQRTRQAFAQSQSVLAEAEQFMRDDASQAQQFNLEDTNLPLLEEVRQCLACTEKPDPYALPDATALLNTLETQQSEAQRRFTEAVHAQITATPQPNA